jgi:ComF family protein
MLFDAECPICGSADPAARVDRSGVCQRCVAALGSPPVLPAPPGLEACRALTAYQGTGRQLVTRLKFHNHRAVVPFVAERLADALAGDRIDVVTWAPTSAGRRRQRGFDQAEVLARAIARKLRVRPRRCLVRLPGPAQTGRHRDERIEGPRFDTHRGVTGAVAGRRVALGDDVATTGATLARAAEVLRSAGADAVIGVVVARTPRVRVEPTEAPVRHECPTPGGPWSP